MGEFTLNAAKTLISFQQVQNSWWHETQHAFLVDSTVNTHIASLSLMQHGKPDLVLVRGLAQDKVHKVRNSQQVMRHCMQPWQHVPCGSRWGTVGQTAEWYKHYQHYSVQSMCLRSCFGADVIAMLHQFLKCFIQCLMYNMLYSV